MASKTAPPPLEVTTRRTIAGMILAMALIESLSGVTQGYLNPILPALGPVFGIDDPTINGIFLISNVSFAVLTPIISRLGDSSASVESGHITEAGLFFIWGALATAALVAAAAGARYPKRLTTEVGA